MINTILKIIDNTKHVFPIGDALLPTIINKPSTDIEEGGDLMRLNVQLTGEGKTYYVDCYTGNDSNDGLTKETAFKTLGKAVDLIPDIMLGSFFNINIASGEYWEVIQLQKPLFADISSSLTLETYETEYGSVARVHTFEILRVGGTVNTRSIQSSNGEIRITDCKYPVDIIAADTKPYITETTGSYQVYIKNSDDVRIHYSHTGGISVDNSTVLLDGCDGECTEYGIYAINFSNVSMVSSEAKPTGVSGEYYADEGSRVITVNHYV